MRDVIDADDQDSLRGGLITLPLADEINKDANTAAQVTGLGNELRPAERAAVLDAQALQLGGIAARMQGRLATQATCSARPAASCSRSATASCSRRHG